MVFPQNLRFTNLLRLFGTSHKYYIKYFYSFTVVSEIKLAAWLTNVFSKTPTFYALCAKKALNSTESSRSISSVSWL
jgi:hypothetical protein